VLKQPVSPYRQSAWSPLAVSAGVHLVLLVLAAGLSRRSSPQQDNERSDHPADEARRVDMIYVPPAEPTLPPAPVRPPPPPPPPAVRQTVPEPEANAPPEATRSNGAETAEQPKDEPRGPKAEKAAPPATTARGQAVATMESEARRIFGRPRLVSRAGAGPQATRPMEAWLPDNSERCTPRPVAPSDSGGVTQFGTVVGRIFRQDNGRPLAGAHLQMIGTPYVTFTDGSGEYRFKFDLSLMDNCRTQYVRVSAAGYESRLLVLVVGPNRSEDVRLRRR
jgi:hypothetical protein